MAAVKVLIAGSRRIEIEIPLNQSRSLQHARNVTRSRQDVPRYLADVGYARVVKSSSMRVFFEVSPLFASRLTAVLWAAGRRLIKEKFLFLHFILLTRSQQARPAILRDALRPHPQSSLSGDQ